MDNKNPRISKKNIVITLKKGDTTTNIELELFDSDLPITCKNFRSVAFNGLKNKTFKNTKVYGILKNKYALFGDITNNNGSGEISLYGKNFIDESFAYKHTYAGTVSMVSRGDNTNTTKFLITTGPCPELDGNNVVFGKVVKGLYGLLSILDSETDNNNLPMEDIEITQLRMI